MGAYVGYGTGVWGERDRCVCEEYGTGVCVEGQVRDKWEKDEIKRNLIPEMQEHNHQFNTSMYE